MEKMKPHQPKDEGALGYEWIVGMSAEFQAAMDRCFKNGDNPPGLTPEVASYWQLRFLLAISQQLSVIAGAVKGGSE